MELFEQIISFSPTNWVHDRKRDMISPATNYNNQAAAEQDWLALVSTFKMALLLYFMRTLVLDHESPPILPLGNGLSVDMNSIRSTTSNSLLTYLRQLLRPDSPRGDGRPWLGKFVFWPLFIAGMECHYSSSMTMAVARKFIADSLCQLSHHQGDLSMLDAASFLQYIWRIQSGPDNFPCADDGRSYEDYKNTDATFENLSHGTLPCALISWDERVARLGPHSLFML
jgi:hypothetical protein